MDNDAILQIRASLGRWQKDGTSIVITDRNVTPQQDLRQYNVIENRGSYLKPHNYNITARDAQAKFKAMQQMGYKLVAPQFPELAEFFRNGKPITAADLLADSINEIETVEDTRTGLEFLLDNWN